MPRDLAGVIRAHPERWALGALVLLMLATFVPGVDLGLSRMFYLPDVGFTWNPDGPLEFVRRTVPTIIIASFVLVVVVWLAGLWRRQWFWGVATPHATYLLVTLVMGPGLIVETVLKPYWGRARPKDITLFGGDAAYTPPLWMADECARNCGFVSGHAAVAFWVTAYAFILPQRWRLPGLLAGLAFGFAMGLVRIIQGAHFLSDVVFAGGIILAVNTALARLSLDRRARAPLA